MTDQPSNANRKFEEALKKSKKTKHLLRLYVAGNTARSAKAISTIREICEKHFQGRYQLEVIDIYQQPSLAVSEQIVATPTLIKYLPPPLRRVIGDLSKEERILIGLDLIELDEGIS